MQRTNIYLAEEQTEQLDHLAVQEGISRAELIRRLLSRALVDAPRDLEVDLDAISSSFGVLADVTPVERAADARGKHLERIWRAGK
jgi:hypothetical protein